MIPNGFIAINRKIENNFLWEEERVFSRFEAWFFLLLNARYAKDVGKKLIKNKLIIIHRGELIFSIRSLAKSWGWSTKKVILFLKTLEKDDMISVKSEVHTTKIIILNFEKYQDISGEPAKRKRNAKNVDALSENKNEETQRKHEGNAENGVLSKNGNAKRNAKETQKKRNIEFKNSELENNDIPEYPQKETQTETQRKPEGIHKNQVVTKEPSIVIAQKFKKPTIEEIATYCRNKNNNIDPVHFFNYYEANGWRVGRNLMKNWQAAVCTWEKNDFNKNKPTVSSSPVYQDASKAVLTALNGGR